MDPIRVRTAFRVSSFLILSALVIKTAQVAMDRSRSSRMEDAAVEETQSSSIGNGWGLLESSTGKFKAMTEGGISAPPSLAPGVPLGFNWVGLD